MSRDKSIKKREFIESKYTDIFDSSLSHFFDEMKKMKLKRDIYDRKFDILDNEDHKFVLTENRMEFISYIL